MHNDGILQVSSISPLQAADISAGTLHPPLGIPLSPHTQAGQDYGKTRSRCTNPPSHTPFKPVKHKLQQIKCVSWDLLSVILH